MGGYGSLENTLNMNTWIKLALIGGALTFGIGFVGLLVMRISYDDGAFVIAGAAMFSGGLIANAIVMKHNIGKE